MKMKWDLQICFQLSKHGNFEGRPSEIPWFSKYMHMVKQLDTVLIETLTILSRVIVLVQFSNGKEFVALKLDIITTNSIIFFFLIKKSPAFLKYNSN